MRGINKVIVIGNLGQDPDVKYTKAGKAVANLSVAVNEQWKDRDGVKQERVEWIKCVIWGAMADIAKQYLRKGDAVYFEGKLQTRQWEDRSGNKRYTTEVQVLEMRMLGSRQNGQQEPTRQDEQKNSAGGWPDEEQKEDGDVPF